MPRSGEEDSSRESLPVRNVRPRDRLGRPLPPGADGVEVPTGPFATTPAAVLEQAQRLLDAGLPFHAHEVLEDQWKVAPAGERDLWRGLAQLAVGITHAARGNRRGAVALLRRGAGLIQPYAEDAPDGLDVSALLGWAEQRAGQLSGADVAGDVASVPQLRGPGGRRSP